MNTQRSPDDTGTDPQNGEGEGQTQTEGGGTGETKPADDDSTASER